jgi:hypothetical protein
LSVRYDVEKADDGTSYQFTTSSGIIYVAYFTEFTLMESDGDEIRAVSFGFACDRSDQVRRHDGRVRQTIVYIIEEFFKAQPDDAMLYMCMDSDGRGRNRHITFSRWFRDVDSELEKHNFASKDQEEAFYSSIIIKSSNPQKQRIVNAFYYTINYWGF